MAKLLCQISTGPHYVTWSCYSLNREGFWHRGEGKCKSCSHWFPELRSRLGHPNPDHSQFPLPFHLLSQLTFPSCPPASCPHILPALGRASTSSSTPVQAGLTWGDLGQGDEDRRRVDSGVLTSYLACPHKMANVHTHPAGIPRLGVSLWASTHKHTHIQVHRVQFWGSAPAAQGAPPVLPPSLSNPASRRFLSPGLSLAPLHLYSLSTPQSLTLSNLVLLCLKFVTPRFHNPRLRARILNQGTPCPAVFLGPLPQGPKLQAQSGVCWTSHPDSKPNGLLSLAQRTHLTSEGVQGEG